MNRSEALYRESCGSSPGGVSSPVRRFEPHPIFFSEGKGSRVTDVDGNEYIDLCMAYGPLIAGHGCEPVMDAVRDQMGRGTVFGAPSEPESELVRRIAECVPSADMVRLACSGTEATMHAIRTARFFTGRDDIVKIDGGYHGAHDSTLVSKGSLRRGSPKPGVPYDAARHTFVAEYNDIDSMAEIVEGNDIACVIMEPVMGNSGVITPEKGYLEAVRKLTADNDAVLIFDEVITGFRLSSGGYQEMCGVTPDMTTLAKIIGGGFPAGAFSGRRRIMETVAPSGDAYCAGTFAGNPVSSAAGCALIDHMRSHDRYGALNRKTERFASSLRDRLTDSGIAGCVNCMGSMFTVFFGRDRVSNGSDANATDQRRFMGMFRYMLKHGIYLPPSGMEVEFTSTEHDETDLNHVEEVFESFLRTVES